MELAITIRSVFIPVVEDAIAATTAGDRIFPVFCGAGLVVVVAALAAASVVEVVEEATVVVVEEVVVVVTGLLISLSSQLVTADAIKMTAITVSKIASVTITYGHFGSFFLAYPANLTIQLTP
jgi:hypothetical protein